MKATDMYIIMKGIKLYAFHGVMEQERKIGANFIIDIKIKTDFSKAAISDSLEETISYADIFNDIRKEMEIPSQLLENVCQRICNRLFLSYSTIEYINIRLFKENPPMNSNSDTVGVEMNYER